MEGNKSQISQNYLDTHLIFRILPVFSQFLWNLTFIFSESHEKFSVVFFQMTNFIFSPWEMQKRMQLKIKITQFPNGIVWKSGEKLLIFSSLISPSKITLFEK